MLKNSSNWRGLIKLFNFNYYNCRLSWKLSSYPMQTYDNILNNFVSFVNASYVAAIFGYF